MRKKIQTHNPITTITTIVIHKYKVVIRLNKIHPYMYTYTSIIIEINKPIIQIKSNLIPSIKKIIFPWNKIITQLEMFLSLCYKDILRKWTFKFSITRDMDFLQIRA